MPNYQDLVCYQVIFEPEKRETLNELNISVFNVIYMKLNNPEQDKVKPKMKKGQCVLI